MRTKLLTTATVVVATSALAGTASAATVKGTVVHTSRHAHSFVVASAAGRLTAVHTTRHLKAGRAVTVHGRTLTNGTFGASSVRLGSRLTHARVHGVVTFADRAHRRFVVSARGVSLVVTAARHRASAAADPVPPVGTTVTATTTIDDQGDLEAQNVQEDGQDTGTTDLEGQVLAVDPAARTLSLSADDDGEITGAAITVDIPASFDITQYHVGDELELVVTPNPDGSYTAVGDSEDGNAQQADDQGDDQGDDGEHGSGSPTASASGGTHGSGDHSDGSGSEDGGGDD